MIRHHDTLPPKLIGFLVDCVMFCHSLPPLLYHDCWQLEENTDLVCKKLTRAVNNLQIGEEKLIARRVVKTMRPLRVIVGGMYFLDRMMTPTYLFVILNSTVTALLSM